MNGQEPALTQTDPKAYYLWLQGQGVPPNVAVQYVQNRFGSPQEYQQRQNKKQAGNSTNNALATTGGMIAGTIVYDQASGLYKDITTNKPVSKPTVDQAGQQAGAQPTQPDASSVSQTPDGSAASAPVTEVGPTTMPDGSPGTQMSDGAKVGQNGEIIKPDGTSGGSFQGQALAGLQIAGGAAQAYNGYKQYQSGEKLGGAANMAGGAYSAAAGAQALYAGGTAGSLSQYAPAVGTAVAAAQVGQQMLNEKGASEDRAAKSDVEAKKSALLYIPGYGWIAYAALMAADALSGGKATEGLIKLQKAEYKLTDKIDLGLGKNIRSKVFHQSTKGRQQERTGQLMQQSDDPQWQNYVAGMRLPQNQEGPKEETKPFYKGQYATFEEYKKAGLQADDLTGVYGNLDAFKPAYAEKQNLPNWAQLTFDQRKAVTQRLIDEDMYASKKGDIVIPDKEKARRIYEEMAANNFGAPPQKNNLDIRGSLQNNLNK